MTIILYQKDFPLGEGVSFSGFINSLDEKYFTNYSVIIDKTSSKNKYRIELVTNIPIWQWTTDNVFIGKVLLSEGEILHSAGSQHFTILAWAKGWNLFNVLFYVVMAIFLLVVGLYAMIPQHNITDLIPLLIIIVVMLAPATSVYLRDRDILNRIGSLGQQL